MTEEKKYFVVVKSTQLRPELISVDAKQLYEGAEDYSQHVRQYTEAPRIFREGKHAKIIVNMAGLGHCFWHDGTIVVSEPLREIIDSCCQVRFMQVEFVGAYCLPIELLGDGGLREVDQLNEGREVPPGESEWTQHWIARLAKKYRCDPPKMPYYETIIAAPIDLGIDPDTLPAYSPNREKCIFNLRVSRELVEERGMLVSRGIAMRPDVWSRIEPYLNRPLFEAFRVAYDDIDRSYAGG
jgi:hypothetical protein